MSAITNTIVTVIVLLAPLGLSYGRYFYLTRMSKHPLKWRKSVTVLALALVSVSVVMWPVARMTAPEVKWQSWVGAGAYMHWVDAWGRAALRILLAALVLSLFGRPRLILPIGFACVGTALFWIFSNIP